MRGTGRMTKLRPDYYKGKDGKDLFDMFEEEFPQDWTTGFYVLNIVKYIRRYKGKNGVEDLNKARTYLDRLIKFEEQFKEKQGEETLFDLINKENSRKNSSKAIAEKQREIFGNGVE